MKPIINANLRLKNVLNKDKSYKSENLISVLKSDLFDLLNNYFIFDINDFIVELNQNENQFNFICKAKCDRIKVLNKLN